MMISIALMSVVIGLFQAGLWEMRRSSGRIDLVRRARNCMDNVQRFLSSATVPGTFAEGAIIFPDPPTNEAELLSDPESSVLFWTPVDHLGVNPLPTARQLHTNMTNLYFRYGLDTIPGHDGLGDDVVLRRYVDEVTIDATSTPRVIGRGLGVPDPGSPGQFMDAFVVRTVRDTAVQIQVNISSELITDDTERNRIQAQSPFVVNFTTIVQLPFYANRT